MLHLYKKNDILPDLPIIKDPVTDSVALSLNENDEKVQLLFKLIEQGVYNGHGYYTDRFGVRLYRGQCSSGLKIALMVLNNPDKVVDGREAGVNAISALAAVCKEGHCITNSSVNSIENLGYKIDVLINGIHYTKFEEDDE